MSTSSGTMALAASRLSRTRWSYRDSWSASAARRIGDDVDASGRSPTRSSTGRSEHREDERDGRRDLLLEARVAEEKDEEKQGEPQHVEREEKRRQRETPRPRRRSHGRGGLPSADSLRSWTRRGPCRTRSTKMAARAAAQAVSSRIRKKRTSTTRRDSPSAKVARSAPRKSGTRSPQARDDAASERRAQRGSGRSGSRRMAAVNASRAMSFLPAASSRRPRRVADRARSVMRRISIFWAYLRISSTFARASGVSPPRGRPSQREPLPSNQLSERRLGWISPGATRTWDGPRSGAGARAGREGTRRRAHEGQAALHGRRGPGGPQPRLAGEAATGALWASSAGEPRERELKLAEQPFERIGLLEGKPRRASSREARGANRRSASPPRDPAAVVPSPGRENLPCRGPRSAPACRGGEGTPGSSPEPPRRARVPVGRAPARGSGRAPRAPLALPRALHRRP